MAILNWKVEFPDQVQDSGAQQTRWCRLACNDQLGTILTAGYLNQIVAPALGQSGLVGQGYVPLAQDMWMICYPGGQFICSVSISSAGVVTLVKGATHLLRFDVTVGEAALASAGKVNLITALGTLSQFRILNLWANLVGTDFSGGSGNRELAITDGTNVFSVIPAADLETLVNSVWGETALPAPASVSFNQLTAAGANLYAQYTGGSADYTAGSIVLSGLYDQVA